MSFHFERFGGGDETPLAEAQAVAPCLLSLLDRASPRTLGRSPPPSPCPVRSCLCTVALAPLLWAPSKPGEVLRRPRGQGERIWRSEHSPSLLRCFKDRICACEASPPLKPPGCCVGAGAGRHSHQKAWEKDATKAVGTSLGPESGRCWKAWDGSPCP